MVNPNSGSVWSGLTLEQLTRLTSSRLGAWFLWTTLNLTANLEATQKLESKRVVQGTSGYLWMKLQFGFGLRPFYFDGFDPSRTSGSLNASRNCVDSEYMRLPGIRARDTNRCDGSTEFQRSPTKPNRNYSPLNATLGTQVSTVNGHTRDNKSPPESFWTPNWLLSASHRNWQIPVKSPV